MTVYACILSAITILLIFIGLHLSAAAAALARLLKLFNPLIIGFVVAYLVNPLMKFFEKKVFAFTERKRPRKELRRGLSLLCAYLVYAIVLCLFIMILIPQVVSSYRIFLSQTDMYLETLQSLVADLGEKYPFLHIEKISAYLSEMIADWYILLQNIVPYITSFLASFIDYFTSALMGIILSIYFLLSKEKLIAQIKKFCYAFLQKKRTDQLIEFMRYTDTTFGGFIMGKLLDSLIIGILTFFVLAIFRMPYYQLIAVIVGVTNIIPFFGPIIGAIPGAFIILIADPSKTIWFLIIILIIQQLDGNVIGPKILGQTMGLSSLGIVIAVTVMGGLLGFAGMFIGVPLFALLQSFFQRFLENMLKKKNLSPEGIPLETEGIPSRPENHTAEEVSAETDGEDIRLRPAHFLSALRNVFAAFRSGSNDPAEKKNPSETEGEDTDEREDISGESGKSEHNRRSEDAEKSESVGKTQHTLSSEASGDDDQGGAK